MWFKQGPQAIFEANHICLVVLSRCYYENQLTTYLRALVTLLTKMCCTLSGKHIFAIKCLHAFFWLLLSLATRHGFRSWRAIVSLAIDWGALASLRGALSDGILRNYRKSEFFTFVDKFNDIDVSFMIP